MARRKVTTSRKAKGRRIVGLAGPSFDYRSAEAVIEDIRKGVHTYYVREASHESTVRVVDDGEEPRLLSTRDILSRNNLENLPDC
jgi:hypothetical protein